MSCETYRSAIVGMLYDDIDETERTGVVGHLSGCLACRETLAALEATRALLREGAPDVPRAPRVLVVGRRVSPARAWLGFAAGLAVALLAAGGAAAGYAYGTARAAPVPPETAPAADLVRQEVDRRWKALESAVVSARREPAEPTPAAVTREDLAAAMLRLERKIDGSRASDLDYMQNLLDASERRTGSWIGETQKALRYVALANDPALSEQ